MVESARPGWIGEIADLRATEGIWLLLQGRRLLLLRLPVLLHERVRRPPLVLALGLAHEVERLLAGHPREVAENLLRRGLQVLQQDVPRLLDERLVTELARLGGVHAAVPGVEVLAGEALVEVEALLLLGAPVEEVELAELEDLRRLRIVRKDAPLGTLK